MSLEDNIRDIIQTKLSDGTIERIVSEKLEKSINDVMDDLFRSYGDVGKVIREKVKEIFVPAIENHDFSDHLVKLDTILTEIVNRTSLTENQQLLENFKELMIEDNNKEINASDLFEEYCKYVAENVDTTDLDIIDEDYPPTYSPVHCSMSIEFSDKPSWATFENGNIIFECEEDDDMNLMIPINRWFKYDGEKWAIRYKTNPDITSLLYMKEFEVFLAKLTRSSCKLIIDCNDQYEDVEVNKEPEVTVTYS